MGRKTCLDEAYEHGKVTYLPTAVLRRVGEYFRVSDKYRRVQGLILNEKEQSVRGMGKKASKLVDDDGIDTR